MPSLSLAAEAATKTLAFIAPEIVLPHIIDQINLDLDPKKLTAIGETELSIWKTEEGVLFVDGELSCQSVGVTFICMFDFSCSPCQ